jgi:spore maturation protein CgeB
MRFSSPARCALEPDLHILFFGLTISSSWGNGHATPYRAIVKALYERGVRPVFYEHDVSYYAKHRDFGTSNYCELVFYQNWDSIRHQALARAQKADVVVTASYLPEGARISEELLGVDGPLHVFYDLDTPITLNALLNGGVDYLRTSLIAEFDLYLSFTGGKILRRLEEEFGARVARPLYGCVDPDIYRRVKASPDFRCRLSYMGTYARDRWAKVQDLFLAPASQLPAEAFLLAGSMYPDSANWPQNVKRIEHVSPAQHPQLYSSSDATLNLTRAEMAQSGYCPSGRFFEAAACGAPLLTDEWEGLDYFFDPAEELTVVNTTEGVVRALRCTDSELKRKAARARQRTLDEHTGRHRAQQFLTYCEEAGRLRHQPQEAWS